MGYGDTDFKARDGRANPQSLLCNCAIEYHRRGWPVIPLRDKTPVVAWKTRQKPEHRPDEQQVRDWFGDWTQRLQDGGKHINGIGIVCGSAAGGLCVRDFDDQHAYHSWAG
jgi:hypothetical protein